MKIRIISFRRSTIREIGALEKDYIDRLKKRVTVELIDLKPCSARESSRDAGARGSLPEVLRRIGPKEFLVTLDSSGKALNSEELADWFKSKLNLGIKIIHFVIGSAEGLDEEIKTRADFRLKLSDLTLPHQLARLILLEAIYRSFDILGARRYHK